MDLKEKIAEVIETSNQEFLAHLYTGCKVGGE